MIGAYIQHILDTLWAIAEGPYVWVDNTDQLDER
jgi:hypothetical protein